MSTDRDVTAIVRSWLDEGATRLPDRVLDNVLDHVPSTPQRRAFWPARRFAGMNHVAKFGITAAAIVVAAAVGIGVVGRPSGQFGNPSPSPTPTPAPSEAGAPRSLHGSTTLDPGTFRNGSGFPVQFDFTITDTWELFDASRDLVRIWKPCRPGACTGFSSILTFEIVRNVYADPCRAVPGPQIGGRVDDLVNALTNLPGFEAGPVASASIDGQAGRSFELDKATRSDPASCVDGGDWLWVSNGPVQFGTGAHQKVTVLSVDGTRLLIDAIVYSGDGREMDAIIDSIDFK